MDISKEKIIMNISEIDYINLIENLGNQLSSIKIGDFFKILNQSLQLLSATFNCERVIVYSFAPEVNFSLFEYKKGQIPTHSTWRKSNFASYLPWVIAELRKNKPIIYEHIAHLPIEAAIEKVIYHSEKVNSIIWQPIFSQGTLIGMLELASFSEIPPWSKIPPAVLATLGVLFSLPLEKRRYEDKIDTLSRTYEKVLDGKNNELTTILNIQKALTSELHIDQVIQLVSDEARRLIDTKFTSVCLMEQNKMKVQVASGPLAPKLHTGSSIPLMNAISTKSLLKGSAIHVKNADLPASNYKDFLHASKIDSLLIMPLVSGKDLVGMISISESENMILGYEQERLLKIFANIAIIAVENARSYQEEQNRREEAEKGKKIAEALRDILRILNSNTALDKILDYIALQSRGLLCASSTMIRKIDYDKSTVFTEASSNLPLEFEVIREIPFYPGGSERVLRENRPVAVSNLQESLGRYLYETQELSNPQQDWVKVLLKYYQSHLIIPLIINNDLYGTLTFYFEQPTVFSDEEIHIGMTLGTQVSLAIENARLRNHEKEMAVAMERNRLARDLHDAVTQTLFSATLIAEVLPKIWIRNQDEGAKRLEELRQLTRGALAEMRTLLLELRPSALQDASFPELLRQLSEALIGRSRIPVNLEIDADIQLPSEIKIAFYRITQETLNNIAKHANATLVTIALFKEDQFVHLKILDNGIGMDLAHIPTNHLGLSIMKERAQNINANLEISSSANGGTRIELSWTNEKGEQSI